MKIVRSYRISRDVLYLDIDGLPDSSEDSDEFVAPWLAPESHLSMWFVVGPNSGRKHDFEVTECTGFSRSFLLDEIASFISNIKSLFKL